MKVRENESNTSIYGDSVLLNICPLPKHLKNFESTMATY